MASPPHPGVKASALHMRYGYAQRVDRRVPPCLGELKSDPHDVISKIAVDVFPRDRMSVPGIVRLDCDVSLAKEGEEGDDSSAYAGDLERVVPIRMMDYYFEHVERDWQLALSAAWASTLLSFDD
jgi:hypothetical protein